MPIVNCTGCNKQAVLNKTGADGQPDLSPIVGWAITDDTILCTVCVEQDVEALGPEDLCDH